MLWETTEPTPEGEPPAPGTPPPDEGGGDEGDDK